MFKDYFQTAFRNLYKNKVFAFVNLVGLSTGLAAMILILSYVRYELSYDTSYSNAKRIYRLVLNKNHDGLTEKSVYVPIALGPTLANELPQVEFATSLDKPWANSFIHKNGLMDVMMEEADTNFFKTFNLPFLYGNPATALNENNNIVIDENTAQKFFPNRNPIGSIMTYKSVYGDSRPFRITGVIKNMPPNMHMQADAISAVNFKRRPLDWQKETIETPQYIILKENTSIDQVKQAMDNIYRKYNFPKGTTLSFQPVRSIHLYSNIPDDPYVNSNIRYIYIFSLIAIMILLVACINYVNLSTARALQRVKEIGMRKVLGANRAQLTLQFLGESFLFFCIALPFALLLAYMFWPAFLRMLNIQAGIQYLLSWQNLLLIAIISLLSGALSGSYPAFFLSALQPVAILKNQKKGFRINLDFRKALIVLQFVISIILIITTIVINKQLYLLNNMQLGFNKDHLLVLSSGRFPKGSQVFKNELLQNSHIKAVTVSDWMMGERLREETTASGSNSAANSFKFTSINADFDFIKAMQLKLLAGRDFSESYSFDIINRDSILAHGQKLTEAQKNAIVLSTPVILSESAVSKLQLENPVGKVLNTDNVKGTVIGVIKNFEGTSLRQQMPPVILHASPSNDFGYTYIKIAPGDITHTLQFIHDTYQKLNPYQNFELSFADERLQQLYTSETRLASLFSVFAGLAILIACMGLFSLIAFIIQQRTKEISIRKVMGASVYNIAKLLTIDFVRLVIISLLIASPIAWWAMHKWLENYAHKIIISWWMFLIAGVLAILITLITVSFQAIKAAVANPVKSLRTE